MLGQRGNQDHVIVRRATGALSACLKEVQPLDGDPIVRVALFVLRAPRFDLHYDRVVPLERRLGGGLTADRRSDQCADQRREQKPRNRARAGRVIVSLSKHSNTANARVRLARRPALKHNNR